MKKFLALALTAAMTMTMLTACGSSEPASAEETEAATEETTEAVEETTEAEESTEAPAEETAEAATSEALADGVLTVGTNAEFPPFEYVGDDGEPDGFDMALVKAIGEKLGVEVQIENMEFASLVSSIGSKIDIAAAGMTVTPEREKEVSFTDSYATGIQSIIVKEGSDIKTADDLSKGGVKIGVQKGTTGDLYCTWDIEDKNLGTVERFAKGADAVMALTSGKVDAVVIDNEPAKVFVKNNEGLQILETSYAVEDYAIAVSKENPELLNEINGALKELTEDGTIKNIIEKYIPAE